MGLWNLHILAQLHNGVFINRRRIVLGSVEAEDMTRVLVHWHMNRHIATIIRHSVSMLMTHDMDDTGAYLVSNHSKKKRSQNGTIIVGKNRLMCILNLNIYIYIDIYILVSNLNNWYLHNKILHCLCIFSILCNIHQKMMTWNHKPDFSKGEQCDVSWSTPRTQPPTPRLLAKALVPFVGCWVSWVRSPDVGISGLRFGKTDSSKIVGVMGEAPGNDQKISKDLFECIKPRDTMGDMGHVSFYYSVVLPKHGWWMMKSPKSQGLRTNDSKKPRHLRHWKHVFQSRLGMVCLFNRWWDGGVFSTFWVW